MKINTRRALCGVFVVASLWAGQTSAQRSMTSNDTLALIGSSAVTVRDLLERLELMPWPGMDRASQVDTIKRRALSAMIAEKLLAIEFDRSGLGMDESVVRLRRGLQQVLLRDELYRREVLGQIVLSPAEIQTGMERFSRTLTVTIVGVRSEFDGQRVHQALISTPSADSLLKAMQGSLVLRTHTTRVDFGEMREHAERLAFDLPVPAASQPFPDIDGSWTLLYVHDSETNPGFSELSAPDRARHVEKVLRRRKEVGRSNAFYREILSSRRAAADSVAFYRLGDELLRIFEEYSSQLFSKGVYTLASELVDDVLKRLGSDAELPFVTIDHDTVVLGDLADMLRYEQFSPHTLQRDTFLLSLNETIKSLTANEILAAEARKRGYHIAPGFRRDMDRWTDYWKGHQLLKHIRDTVAITHNDMLAHLMAHADVFGDRYEVNVREVLVPSMTELSTVLSDLRSGIAFGELARKHSIRIEWAGLGGESGYMRVDLHPEIGCRSLLADVGEMVGPISLSEGVSLFEVLDIRPIRNTFPVGDSLRQVLGDRLLKDRQSASVSAVIASSARSIGVQIDDKVLSNVRISSINMFTRRYVGFGGTMTAVPLLFHQWEWIEQLRAASTPLP